MTLAQITLWFRLWLQANSYLLELGDENDVHSPPARQETITMTWLETINFRSTRKELLEVVQNILEEAVSQCNDTPPQECLLYRNLLVGCDLTIHIIWSLKASNPRKSELGKEISYHLGKIGLVSHSLWEKHARYTQFK